MTAETTPMAARPANCTMRLRAEGKAAPRSGCAVSSCKNGGMRGCVYDRRRPQAETDRPSPMGGQSAEPRSADRAHAPELEQHAYNQMPKNGYAELKLYRYDGTDLYQWYGRKQEGIRRTASVFWDACDEPFVIPPPPSPRPSGAAPGVTGEELDRLEGLLKAERDARDRRWPIGDLSTIPDDFNEIEASWGDAHAKLLDAAVNALPALIQAARSTLSTAEAVGALKVCRDKFLFYQEQHLEKRSVDGDRKAEINAALAEMCAATLSRLKSSSTGGGE